MQMAIICSCIAAASFICGLLWNEAGHEVKKEAEANARAKAMLPGQRKY